MITFLIEFRYVGIIEVFYTLCVKIKCNIYMLVIPSVVLSVRLNTHTRVSQYDYKINNKFFNQDKIVAFKITSNIRVKNKNKLININGISFDYT